MVGMVERIGGSAMGPSRDSLNSQPRFVEPEGFCFCSSFSTRLPSFCLEIGRNFPLSSYNGKCYVAKSHTYFQELLLSALCWCLQTHE